METQLRSIVKGIVTCPVNWMAAPEATGYPHVILRLVRSDGEHTFDGPIRDFVMSNVLIEVWSTSHLEMTEIRDQVIEQIDGYSGTSGISNIMFEDLMTEVRTDQSPIIYRAGIGVAVWHDR